MPVYLHILLGLGAFIASVCFVAFLYAAEILRYNDGELKLALGIAFVASAFVLDTVLKGKSNGSRSVVSVLLPICAMSVGKIIFVLGFTISLGTRNAFSADGIAIIAAGIFVITAVTYPFFNMISDRFLSVFAFLGVLVLNFDKTAALFPYYRETIYLVQIAAVALFVISGRINRIYIPIAYAAAFTLCISILLLLAEKTSGWIGRPSVDTLFINIVLTTSLVGLIGWASGSLERWRSEPVILASVGALLLGLISAPGITLALCLMIIGYAKHERVLLTLGILMLPITIFYFYYSINLTLMLKSGVMVGGGVLLLIGYAYVAARKFNAQVKP